MSQRLPTRSVRGLQRRPTLLPAGHHPPYHHHLHHPIPTLLLLQNHPRIRTFLIPTPIPEPKITIPVTPHCPSPTCPCSATPPDPIGPDPIGPDGKPLEIKRVKNLYDSFPQFDSQILICSGENDWPHTRDIYRSRDGGAKELPLSVQLLTRLKDAIAKTRTRAYGLADDRYLSTQVGLLNTSLPSTPSDYPGLVFSAYIMPQNIYLPHIHTFDRKTQWQDLARLQIPEEYPSVDDVVQLLYPDDTTVTEEMRTSHDVLILVCGHATQDARCGVYGPLLCKEFRLVLQSIGYEVEETSAGSAEEAEMKTEPLHPDMPFGSEKPASSRRPRARIAVTSHVGGHAFAGNVGIWFPGTWTQAQDTGNDGVPIASEDDSHSTSDHNLAGHGIWYGRVAPHHVEGIINETILHGRIIGELLRGGVDARGQSLTATRRLTWPGMDDSPSTLPVANPFAMDVRDADDPPEKTDAEAEAEAEADATAVGINGEKSRKRKEALGDSVYRALEFGDVDETQRRKRVAREISDLAKVRAERKRTAAEELRNLPESTF